MWIEIFKSGVHQDSLGRKNTYTFEKLDRIVNNYNKQVFEENEKAPLVKGHPKDNSPAYGWIDKLARRGTKIFANISGVDASLKEEIKTGMFKHISVGLYEDDNLRHVGLLGAVPPAVKGLKPVEFKNEKEYQIIETGNLNYKDDGQGLNLKILEQKEKHDSFDYKEKYEALEQEHDALKQKIQAITKKERLKDFRNFVNSLQGKKTFITPSLESELIDILEKSYLADEILEYNEEKPLVDRIKSFCEKIHPENSIALTGEITAPMEEIRSFTEDNIDPERLNLHEEALKLTGEKPELSYEEAVCEVSLRKL